MLSEDSPQQGDAVTEAQLAWIGEQLRSHDAAAIADLHLRTSLVVREAKLERLNRDIDQLSELQLLDLGDNRLRRLPPSIGRLGQLRALRLSGNALSTVPASLGELSQLRELVLKSNSILRLPDTIGDLSMLEELDLSDNTMEELPQSLVRLAALRRLNVSHNRDLGQLPTMLGDLRNLRSLDVQYCGLTLLPESIGDLTQLEELESGGNPIVALPSSLSRLRSLRTLRLNFGKLEEFPLMITECTALRALSLAFSELKSLPESIGKLSELEILVLAETGLTRIPAAVGCLLNLRELDLCENQIAVLPDQIFALDQLRILGLSGNPIAELPERMAELTGLRELYLEDTPLSLDAAMRRRLTEMLPEVQIHFGRKAVADAKRVPASNEDVAFLEGLLKEMNAEDGDISDETGDDDDDEYEVPSMRSAFAAALFDMGEDIRWRDTTASFTTQGWDDQPRTCYATIDEERELLMVTASTSIQIPHDRHGEAGIVLSAINDLLPTTCFYIDSENEEVRVRVSTRVGIVYLLDSELMWAVQEVMSALRREVRLRELSLAPVPGAILGGLSRRRQVEMRLEECLAEAGYDPREAYRILALRYGAQGDDYTLADRMSEGFGGSMGANWASQQLVRTLGRLAQMAAPDSADAAVSMDG